ncbi:hypothetical protein OG234_24805 [Streptomyces sp. NBC_01420]
MSAFTAVLLVAAADGVGPGYYADGGQLARINKHASEIELWP